MPRVVFFTIHSTTPWWTYLASRIDFADAKVLSDLRDEGDWSLVDDFYRAFRGTNARAAALDRFGEGGSADIILRCRSLRSLDPDLALKMIGAMAQAIETAFDAMKPDLVVTFTMDRYVMDVMDRIARARGVTFLEMTTSILPNEVMFLERGRLTHLREPTDREIDAAVDLLCNTDFAPTYVRDAKKFSAGRFWKVFGYYALRGAYFNVRRYLRRDPLNLHYIDALKRLKHKVGVRDIAVLGLLDGAWARHLDDTPREKRVFFGLQLFPEASMDYWLRDPQLLPHDDIVVRYCEVLGKAGYRIFVKDHPLQFGFRQRHLLQRLSKMSQVTLVPYDVPATVLLAQCGVSVTFTGTIGFQAAIAGLCSVVTEPYYASEDPYLHVRTAQEIDGIADRIAAWRPPPDLNAARRAMIRNLAEGSVEGDYFTWKDFDPGDPDARARVEPLVRSLNTYLPRFMKQPTAPAIANDGVPIT